MCFLFFFTERRTAICATKLYFTSATCHAKQATKLGEFTQKKYGMQLNDTQQNDGLTQKSWIKMKMNLMKKKVELKWWITPMTPPKNVGFNK